MARIDINAIMRKELEDRLKTTSYSSLSVPSFYHSYSLAVEYAKYWFTKRLPIFSKNGIILEDRNALDDFRRLLKDEQYVKERPLLRISAIPNLEFDLDTVHMYHYGQNLYTSRGWSSDPFISDHKNGIYMSMTLGLMEINVSYKIIVLEKAQQYDLHEKMKIIFRIGATEGQDIDLDFHIPDDIMVNLANKAGFEVDWGIKRVKDPIKFLRYVNSISAFPILYKMRNITGNNEFFMRIPDQYVHVNCGNKLQTDEGTNVGQNGVKNDFGIQFDVTIRMPYPQFYVLSSSSALDHTFERDEVSPGHLIYDIMTFKNVNIPDEDSNGWKKMFWTQYHPDDGDIEIDLKEFLGDSEFMNVMQSVLSRGISPSAYMHIRIATADPSKDSFLRYSMNWDDRIIKFVDSLPEDDAYKTLFIVFYVDLEFYNAELSSIKAIAKTRMIESSNRLSDDYNK